MLAQVYDCLVGQSVQAWRWIIADGTPNRDDVRAERSDHSERPESLALLRKLARIDPRITVLRDRQAYGVADTRNVALEHILRRQIAPFILPLDDDDLLELTAIDKAVWTLESNPQWAIASYCARDVCLGMELTPTDWVKFGAQNTTETRGLHHGEDNLLRDNFVANAAMFRIEAVKACRYDPLLSDGGEDWQFCAYACARHADRSGLCLAGNGRWGATLPELLYWYRVNPQTLRHSRWGASFTEGASDLRVRVQERNRHIISGGFLQVQEVPASVPLEPVRWSSPIEGRVGARGSRAIMILLPWSVVDWLANR